MKTLKVYFITASIMLVGVGIASAKQAKEKPKEKKEAAKGATNKKDGKVQNDIAVKKQGNPSGSNAAGAKGQTPSATTK